MFVIFRGLRKCMEIGSSLFGGFVLLGLAKSDSMDIHVRLGLMLDKLEISNIGFFFRV